MTTTGSAFLDTVVGIVGVAASLGVVIGGIGYCIGQYKGGSTRGKLEALQLSESERDLLKDRIRHIEEDFKARTHEFQARELELNTRMTKLEAENQVLRDLVTMATVPPQLAALVDGVAVRSVEAINTLRESLASLPSEVAGAVVSAIAAKAAKPGA